MAVFEIERDGKRYQIEAPDQQSAVQALQGYTPVQQQGQSPPSWEPDPYFADLPVPGYPSPQPPPAQPEAGSWQRGMLAPVEVNSETGAFRPAMPQALLDAWSAVTLPGDVYNGHEAQAFDPRLSNSDMADEDYKRVLDLGGMVTPGAPTGPRGLTTPSGDIANSQVAKALARDGFSAQGANTELARLGPGGILADLGPSLQGLATGVARTPGEGQSELMNYLRTRAFESRERIQPQVDSILGPSVSSGQWSGNVKDMRNATGPLYKSAFDSAAPVQTAPIVSSLDALIGQSVGAGKARLQSVRAMFDGPNGATDDPRILFAIRNEIDDMLDSPEVGRIAESLKDVRASVDGELAANVPGIKEADAQWQEIARQQEGFDEGRKIFLQGQDAVDPRDLGPRMEQGAIPKGTLIGPSGESFALSQGGRNELDRLIGTGTQNRTNLASAIRGDGSWNRQKLAQLYGDEKADQLIRLFDNEARMGETERMAVGSSITASATAAQKALEPTSSTSPMLGGPLIVDPGNVAKRLAETIFGNSLETAATKRNQEIAQLLMSQGGWNENKMNSPEQLAVIRALLMSGEGYANPERSPQ